MNRTMLLGLDGAAFRVLDPLMDAGVMPFLRDFVNKGVRAPLMSTANPLTPPAWISMTTGKSPGHHGVFDFIWSEERAKDHYFTLYNYRDIFCETLWEMVSRAGGRVCVFNFPMTAPPPTVRGVVVPGLLSWKHLRLNVHPREAYEEMKRIEGFKPKVLSWDFELEKKAELGVPEAEMEEWIRFHIDREQQWFRVVRHFLRKGDWDLLAVVFDGTDKLLHIAWRYVDPEFAKELTPEEGRIRNLCLDYFRRLDGILQEIVTEAGPQARTFMASDHGFGPSWLVFRVNKWLEEQGCLVWKDDQAADEATRAKIRKLEEKHFVYLDWPKTLAYARTSSSNGIYIRVARDGKTGVAPERYEAFRNELKDKLLQVRDPETGSRVVKQVLTKEEAFPGPHNEQAPDLTLVLADHSFISTRNLAPAVIRREKVAGTHYPDGIFLAAGPGVRRGVTSEPLSIVQVASTLLYSLGLPVPEDLEIGVPEEIFESDYRREHPVVLGPATSSFHHESMDGGSSQEDQEVYKQLKALGYLD